MPLPTIDLSRSDNTRVVKQLLNSLKIPVKSLSRQQVNWINAKTTPEPAAGVDNVVRNLLPLPKNAASLLMKKTINSNKMNDNSIGDDEKAVMAKVVMNAYKRTGKLSGGTEYEDYKGATDDMGYNQIMKAKQGNVNPILGTALATYDPAYRMATTTGRGSYTINPDNHDEIVYTDGYDFKNSFTTDSKTGKTKANYMGKVSKNPLVAQYQKLRKSLAINDDNLQNPDDFKTKFNLNASDTLKLRRPTK